MQKLLVVLLLGLAACRQSSGPHLEALLDDARRLIALGEVPEAEHKLNELERRGGTNDSLKWQARQLRAEILVLQRKGTDALPLLAADAPADLRHPELAARRLMLKASACTQANEPKRAAELLDTAWDEASRLGNIGLQGEIEQRRAVLALALRNADAGVQHLSRGLELARIARDERLECQLLGNRGWLEGNRNRFSEAIDYLERSLSMATRLGMKSAASKISGNLGWCYRSLGDFDAAEQYLLRAADTAKEYGLTGDRQTWLLNLGNLEFQRHRLAEAQSYWLQATAIKASADLGAIYNNLARASLELGKIDEAERYSEQSIAIKAKQQDPIANLHSRLMTARIARSRGDQRAAESELRSILLARPGDPQLVSATHLLLGQVLLSLGNATGAEAEYKRAVDVLVRVRSELLRDEQKLSYQSIQADSYDEYIRLLMARGKTKEALAVADFSRTRSLDERLGRGADQSIPAAGSLKAPRGTVALVYWFSEDKSFLWAVDGARVWSYTLPAGRKQIDSMVEEYRRLLMSPLVAENALRWRGQELYRAIIEPAAKVMRPGARLAVIPDGALHRLDVGSLVMPGDGVHFLIEDYPVAQFPALHLRVQRTTAAPTRTLLAIGNSITKGTPVPPLARAGKEMRMVASHFDSSRTLLIEGPAASPSAYRSSHPETFRFIHVAAHGMGNTVNPLESALLLSPEAQGYRLYARDILKDPIDADLVTISACFGSGTRSYEGEGLVGLAWAFLRAGAKNVVSTLTQVSDTTTPQLMDRFYAGIASGQDPASALRVAKLEMIHSQDVSRLPQYWAPFVVYSRE